MHSWERARDLEQNQDLRCHSAQTLYVSFNSTQFSHTQNSRAFVKDHIHACSICPLRRDSQPSAANWLLWHISLDASPWLISWSNSIVKSCDPRNLLEWWELVFYNLFQWCIFCLSVCLSMYFCSGTCTGQNKASDFLEVELSAAMPCPLWVMELNSIKAVCTSSLLVISKAFPRQIVNVNLDYLRLIIFL